MREADVVARRPQRAAGAVSGDRAKCRDAGHDRNGSAGTRFDAARSRCLRDGCRERRCRRRCNRPAALPAAHTRRAARAGRAPATRTASRGLPAAARPTRTPSSATLRDTARRSARIRRARSADPCSHSAGRPRAAPASLRCRWLRASRGAGPSAAASCWPRAPRTPAAGAADDVGGPPRIGLRRRREQERIDGAETPSPERTRGRHCAAAGRWRGPVRRSACATAASRAAACVRTGKLEAVDVRDIDRRRGRAAYLPRTRPKRYSTPLRVMMARDESAARRRPAQRPPRGAPRSNRSTSSTARAARRDRSGPVEVEIRRGGRSRPLCGTMAARANRPRRDRRRRSKRPRKGDSRRALADRAAGAAARRVRVRAALPRAALHAIRCSARWFATSGGRPACCASTRAPGGAEARRPVRRRPRLLGASCRPRRGGRGAPPRRARRSSPATAASSRPFRDIDYGLQIRWRQRTRCCRPR